VVFSVTMLVLAGGSSFLFIRSVLNAETLTLYPSACLGGWDNPERAQGELTEDASNLHAFAEGSSAILPADTVSEIFCGGFTADIPPGTEPKTLTLLLAWSTERAEDPPVVSGEDFASSSREVLDAPAGSEPSFELIEPKDTPLEEAPASEEPPAPPAEPPVEEPADTAPESTPEPAADPGPVSLLKRLVATAYAQEEEPPAPEPDPLPDGPAPPEEVPVVLPNAAFIEVRYTLDGTTWHSLGTFDKEHVVPTTFSIPVPPETSWTNLSSFQISVRSSATLDGAPPVYLDGMELRVGYDPLAVTRFFADKDLYAMTDLMVISSSEPRSAVQVYWLDDPDTAPEASNVYAAIVGDDGTVALEAKTLFPGRFMLVNTTQKWHCSNLYLSQCIARGSLGQTLVTVALPEDIPGILAARLASSTASTTSEVPPAEGEPSPVPVIEVPPDEDPGPPVESPEPEPEPVVPLENDAPDAPPAE
jgi:hypothetical protein